MLFQRGDRVGQYTLQNISAGGALVSGERDLRPGHLVHVLVDFERGDGLMSLTGAVRRVREHPDDDGNGVGLAIAFPVLSPDQEDAIHDAVLRALLHRESDQARRPLLVFEPRRRVREEIESEIRSFGRSVVSAETLAEAVSELENDDTEYAALVIHSVTHDPRAMDVVEFFTRNEGLPTVILPDPAGVLTERAKRLASLPHVDVPKVWSRSELRRALSR